MQNSRGGLRDIPCRGRAGATPASARSRRGKAHGRASETKDRPFRRTEIAAYLNPPSSDLTAEARRTTRRWLKVENRGASSSICSADRRLRDDQLWEHETSHLSLARDRRTENSISSSCYYVAASFSSTRARE